LNYGEGGQIVKACQASFLRTQIDSCSRLLDKRWMLVLLEINRSARCRSDRPRSGCLSGRAGLGVWSGRRRCRACPARPRGCARRSRTDPWTGACPG